jgi:hypothetical protein
MPGEGIEFHERTLVQQQPDAFAGSQFPASVLPLDGAGRRRVHVLVHSPFEVGDLAGRGVRGFEAPVRGRLDDVLGARGPTHLLEVTQPKGLWSNVRRS